MEKKGLLLSSAKKWVTPNIHESCNRWRRITIGILILFVSVGSASCSLKKPIQYEKGGIILRPHSKLISGVTGMERMRLDHPANISKDVLRNQLRSLRYQELSLLGKEKSIYEPKEADQLAPLLVKGLKRISHNSILYHQIDGKHGRVAGDVFFIQNRLHWRFHTIAGIDFFNQRLRAFPGSKGQGTFWRLVPHKGQGYHKSENASLGFKWENWIVANLNLPKRKILYKNKNKELRSTSSVKKKRTKTKRPTANSQKSSVTPELEKKLEGLRDLHDQNLIQDEEYDLKRKELLDEYL